MMARLPGVFPDVSDGNLGIAATGGDGIRVVVGVASVGVVNAMLGLSDLADVVSKAGRGPGARAVADQLAIGGGIVWFVRAAGDIAGTITPDVANAVAPAITTTGSAVNDNYNVLVTIVAPGAVGVATFRYSLDDGANESEVTTTAAVYAIPGSGITLNFATGAYVAASVYKFATQSPKASVSSVQAAIRAAIASSIIYEYIQLAQPSDAAMWSTLQALQLEAEAVFRYCMIFAETAAPGSDPDVWVNARLAEIAGFSSGNGQVAIIAEWSETTDTLSGRLEVQSMAARILGRASRNPVHVKVSWVGGSGPIVGANVMAPFTVVDASSKRKETKRTGAHSLALEQAGYITGYLLRGAKGVYVVEDRTAAGSTSDFKIVPNRRVINKAVNLVRTALLPDVQRHIDPAEITAATASSIAKANAQIRSMRTAKEIVRDRKSVV